MGFEFDLTKSRANKLKHGIDFEEAQTLWSDPKLLVADARTSEEPRFLAIGRIQGRHWSAVFTIRDGRTRLISVRRARREEVWHYEGE